RGLDLEVMAAPRVHAHDLAAPGHADALLGRLVALHLRHGRVQSPIVGTAAGAAAPLLGFTGVAGAVSGSVAAVDSAASGASAAAGSIAGAAGAAAAAGLAAAATGA